MLQSTGAMPGTLYVVATPIGNLEDITLRALRILKDVDLIACEDTRQTRKLLSRYGVKTPMISYHEHNEHQRSRELICNIKAGASIALVSDAGAPTISDPGSLLIQRAIAEGIMVVPIPGPSALVTSLMAAGLSTDKFLFIGFLPAKQVARRRELDALKTLPYTLVFYEAPHRLRATVQDMLDILGDRSAVLARELTKIHEDVTRSWLSQLRDGLKAQPVKGEIVLILSGASEADSHQPPFVAHEQTVADAIREHMQAANLNLKAAIRRVAHERGLGKNEVYKVYLKQKAERES